MAQPIRWNPLRAAMWGAIVGAVLGLYNIMNAAPLPELGNAGWLGHRFGQVAGGAFFLAVLAGLLALLRNLVVLGVRR